MYTLPETFVNELFRPPVMMMFPSVRPIEREYD